MLRIFLLILFFLFISIKISFSKDIVINEDEWPCKLHHLEAPKQTDFWPGKNITLDSKWKEDKDVRDLVNYITNHANSLDQGKKAINEFSNKFNDKNVKKKNLI